MTSIPHSGAKSVTPGGSVAGHTPGPWEVVRINERGQQTPDGDSWWVYAGEGNGWVGESYFSACIGSQNSSPANARLIAAAPDLLAVVIKSHEPYVGLDEEDIRCLYGVDEADLAMALRDAIAKATAGETRNAEGAL